MDKWMAFIRKIFGNSADASASRGISVDQEKRVAQLQAAAMPAPVEASPPKVLQDNDGNAAAGFGSQVVPVMRESANVLQNSTIAGADERRANWLRQRQADFEHRQADWESKRSEWRDKQGAFIARLEASRDRLEATLSQRLARLEDFKVKQSSTSSALHRDRLLSWIEIEKARIADTRRRIEQTNANICRAQSRLG